MLSSFLIDIARIPTLHRCVKKNKTSRFNSHATNLLWMNLLPRGRSSVFEGVRTTGSDDLVLFPRRNPVLAVSTSDIIPKKQMFRNHYIPMFMRLLIPLTYPGHHRIMDLDLLVRIHALAEAAAKPNIKEKKNNKKENQRREHVIFILDLIFPHAKWFSSYSTYKKNVQ